MKLWLNIPNTFYWLLLIIILALLASPLWASDDDDCEQYDDAVLTADELDAQDDYARHMEMDDEWILVEQRVEEQQNTIDSLEQRELELRRELELLREEAAAKAAADEARRIALGEALKSYGKENDT